MIAPARYLRRATPAQKCCWPLLPVSGTARAVCSDELFNDVFRGSTPNSIASHFGKGVLSYGEAMADGNGEVHMATEGQTATESLHEQVQDRQLGDRAAADWSQHP